jgi:hypothetical protein
LSKVSPCIDSGTTYYKIKDNIILNLAKNDYNGNAPDIGFFESNYIATKIREDKNFNFSFSAFPNPFNSNIIISFALSEIYNTNISIFNSVGQKITDLLQKKLSPGDYKINWNGTDENGIKVSSGIYIIKLNTGIKSFSKNVVLIK